jgi:malate dehydrogenase (oxaloacetate-decarboxylating)(NADP+)
MRGARGPHGGTILCLSLAILLAAAEPPGACSAAAAEPPSGAESAADMIGRAAAAARPQPACHAARPPPPPTASSIARAAPADRSAAAAAEGGGAPTDRRSLLQAAALAAQALAFPAAASPAAAAVAAAPSAAAALPPASQCPLLPAATGSAALRDPWATSGLATAAGDRAALGVRGLLPARVTTLVAEVERARRALASAASPMDAWRMLAALQASNARAFYALLQLHPAEVLPVAYTPTIGAACLAWGSLLQRPPALYASLEDAGRLRALVDAWPEAGVRLAVVTDGERILGLGDLGAHGAGIPAGKAAVYAAAGVDPRAVLPIVLDVGCNSASVRDSPDYVGLPRDRERGPAYLALFDELVAALRGRFGPAFLVHFEDFGAANAFPLLARLQAARVPCFSDDIQGTAAITAAAVLTATRLPGVPPLAEQTFLFFGAGQANLGVAALLVDALAARGVPRADARRRMWLMDQSGLVTSDRRDLGPEKAPFAQPPGAAGLPPRPTLAAAVAAIRPTALIGASTVGGAFDEAVLAALLRGLPSARTRPLVFALSNPSDNAEASFADAYRWSGGRAVYASGTQFPGLEVDAASGRVLREVPVAEGAAGDAGDAEAGSGTRRLLPSQANNCFVFPGLALGSLATGATLIDDASLLAAAKAIAGMVGERELARDSILPPLSALRAVALRVAAAVAASQAPAGAVGATAPVGGGLCVGGGGVSLECRRLQFDALTA